MRLYSYILGEKVTHEKHRDFNIGSTGGCLRT